MNNKNVSSVVLRLRNWKKMTSSTIVWRKQNWQIIILMNLENTCYLLKYSVDGHKKKKGSECIKMHLREKY